MKSLCLMILICFLAAPAWAEKRQCQTQETDGHRATICLNDPGPLKHWIFTLVVDNEPVFGLVDDFAEEVHLTHTIPPGLTLELPLSRGKKGKVVLSGGCKPVSDGELEVARICNFTWGDVRIIRDVRFVHAER